MILNYAGAFVIVFAAITGSQCLAQPEYTIGVGSDTMAGPWKGRLKAGTDPKQPIEMIRLLGDFRIQQLLVLSKEQVEEYQKLDDALNSRAKRFSPGEDIRKFFGTGKAKEEACTRYLDDVLLPPQRKRLNQMAYRTEIEMLGLASSIANGRLADAIGVTDDERASLANRLWKIESEAEAKILAIRAAAEKAALLELSTEQRNRAADVLGEFYLYRAFNEGDMVRKRILNQQKKADQSPKPSN